MIKRRERAARWLALAFAAALMLAAPGAALAQEEEQPVVYGVLLYSPRCPHCHTFIENDWPRINEEFGEQFVLLFINVASQGGNELARAIYEVYQIPDSERYVPMMIIGDNVLVGSLDIPARAPDVIREGLASGGIELPPVPLLRDAYQQALAQAEAEQAGATPPSQATATPEAQPVAEARQPEPPTAPQVDPLPDLSESAGADTLGARLARDPVANALAVAVLLGLAASAGAIVVSGARGLSAQGGGAFAWLGSRPGHLVALAVALAGLGVALMLLAQTGGDPLATLLAVITVVLLAAAAFAIGSHGLRGGQQGGSRSLPGWLIPVASAAGLAVALYLAVIEVGQEQAVCGLVGDCNTVQQSQYATLFGVLPVGVLGVIGFAAMLAVWAAARFGGERLADPANLLLLGMALFGSAFSIYLTFLEPFVIGATCAWCLTSALVMLLLLWLIAPEGLRAARQIAGR